MSYMHNFTHKTLPSMPDHFANASSGPVLDIGMTVQSAHSTPMTLSGMEETVTPPVHVVLSTILHISPKPSARQLLMTWN